MNAVAVAEKPGQRREKRGGGYMGSGKAANALYGAPTASERKLAPEDARQTARLTVEQVSDSFGTRGRVMPMVEVLARRGSLTPRQARAGARIYAAWALGICGAHDADASGGGTADHAGYRDAQLDAATEYRRIRDAVGGRLWPVVFAVACEDWTPTRWANERGGGMHKLGAAELLRVGLDMAADCIGNDE